MKKLKRQFLLWLLKGSDLTAGITFSHITFGENIRDNKFEIHADILVLNGTKIKNAILQCELCDLINSDEK